MKTFNDVVLDIDPPSDDELARQLKEEAKGRPPVPDVLIRPSLLVPPGPRDSSLPLEKRIILSYKEKELAGTAAPRVWPNRPDALDDAFRYSQLPLLADVYWESYCGACAAIEQGASVQSAFGVFDCTPRMIASWIRIGNHHQINEIDSYFSRFTTDVLRALSRARGGAEREVYSETPMAYLSVGPGQALGSEYSPKAEGLPEITEQVRKVDAPNTEPKELDSHQASIAQAERTKSMLDLLMNHGIELESIQSWQEKQSRKLLEQKDISDVSSSDQRPTGDPSDSDSE